MDWDTARLIGVYHANGGIIGELGYVLGKLTGTAHCALCDVTHGMVSMKSDFRQCMTRWPMTLLHLNEQDSGLAEFTEGRTPCVVLENAGGYELLLSVEHLEAMKGDVERFTQAVVEALAARSA